jgi:uncharacterized protein (TIGR00369 family)
VTFADGETGRQVARYIRAEMREIDGGRIVGRAPAVDYLRAPNGSMHVGGLLTVLDYVGGVCGGLASLPDGWVVSTNLSARFAAPARVGPFVVEGAVVRRGRNGVVTSVRMRDEGAANALVADGILTSAILVPEMGVPHWERPLRIDAPPMGDDLPPLTEWLGLRTVDATTVEVDLVDEHRNPWGIMHGGVVASLVDLAAAHATGLVTADVVLHYLAPNRTGPVRATATPLGTRSDGTVTRVEVRDEGQDRRTAVAVITARA